MDGDTTAPDRDSSCCVPCPPLNFRVIRLPIYRSLFSSIPKQKRPPPTLEKAVRETRNTCSGHSQAPPVRSPALASLSRFGASARTREFGERRTLIGFLPAATHLRGPTRRLHLLSIGAQGPDNLSELANPAGPFGPVKHRQVARGNRRE